MNLFFILETKNSSYFNLKYIISIKCKMFLFGFMFTFKDMWGTISYMDISVRSELKSQKPHIHWHE